MTTNVTVRVRLRTLAGFFACALMGMIAAWVPAHGADGVRAPTFTAAQVLRGKKRYEMSCAGCHGMSLVPDDSQVAALTGPQFRTAWQGRSVADRLAAITETMPPDGAGILNAGDYTDIVAYILSFNGYPPGTEELPTNVSALRTMIIGTTLGFRD